MGERRKFWKLGITLQFLKVTLTIAAALTLVSFFALARAVTDSQHGVSWRVHLVLLQVCFSGAIFMFLVSIFYIVHRALGPLLRVEGILDKVIAGDHTQRIALRDKDLMASFMKKVNSIIALLEKSRAG